MAYPAVNSLIQTLDIFQVTYPSLFHGQTAEMINSLHTSAEYFQNILESTSYQKHEYAKRKDLEGEMRAIVQQAEELLELNIAEIMRERHHQPKWKKTKRKWTIQDEARTLLRGLPQAIDVIDTVRKDLAQVIRFSTSTNGTAEDNFFETGGSSSPKHASNVVLPQDTMVGLDDDLTRIIDLIFGSASKRQVITITGIGGSGKGTLAKLAQDDPSIKSHFDKQAWITISLKYHLQELMLRLVLCLTGNEFQEMSVDQLMEEAHRALKGRKYLIVIDDIWSTKIWDVLRRCLPDDNNGSRIIATTRIRYVAEYVSPDVPIHVMRLLTLDESWKLLHDKLFGRKHNFPSELEETGKQIVEKCRGLPLAILVVAGHLSKVPMTKESWATVAEDVSEVISSSPYGYEAIFAMSYHHLPIHLKHCFLHIGIFPEDSDINTNSLIRLWVAEGFLRSDRLKSPEEVARECLEDLISRNLVMVKRRKSNGQIKSCGMHDMLRDLSVREARKEKFLDVITINKVSNCSATNHGIHRFCSHTHISLREFSNSSQVVRCLYLFNELHEPTGETLKFKALRVLYFPRSIFTPDITLNPAILRYIEITTYSQLSESLIFMYNLQTVILHCHKLGPYGILTLSRKIWNLKQLRHLSIRNSTHSPNPQNLPELTSQHFASCRKEVLSCFTNLKKLKTDTRRNTKGLGATSGAFCLPNPQGFSSTNVEESNSDLGLQNLQELSSVCFTSCTKQVLSCLPNLKKLKIHRIGRGIKGFKKTSASLLNLVYLKQLESLYLYFEMEQPLSSSLVDCLFSPLSLKRLTIYSGRLPLASLAKLPNLEVLKLRFCTFMGEVWNLNDEDHQFNQLKFLMLDNIELEQWEAGCINFPNLQRLVLQQIRKLKLIPPAFAEICSLESLELYKCTRAFEKSAREFQEEVASLAGHDCLYLRITDDPYQFVKRHI